MTLNASTRIFDNESLGIMPDFSLSLGIMYPSKGNGLEEQDIKSAQIGLNLIPKFNRMRFVVAPFISMDLVEVKAPIVYGISFGLAYLSN